ncbi:hypothetical protein BH23GEM2_BH23GEM2_01960 [soil metagenome]
MLRPAVSGRSAWLPVLAVLLLAAGNVRAQETEPATDSARAKPTLAVEGLRLRMPDRVQFLTTAAFGSPQHGWLGQTPGRDVFLGVIRMSWRVAGSDRGAGFGFFGEFIPVAMVTSNPIDVLPLRDCVVDHPEWADQGSVPAIEYFEECTVKSASAYGVGITPFGISGRFARSNGTALVTELSVGAVMFDKTVPYPTATRFNYNVTLGTSIEIPVASRSFISLGYNLHHLSNGGRGEFNPGIAAHAVQVGWGRRGR